MSTRLEKVVQQVLSFSFPCILIDDGGSKLENFRSPIRISPIGIATSKNQGKGLPFSQDFVRPPTWNVVIFCKSTPMASTLHRGYRENFHSAQAIIAGYPIYDESVPKLRLYARYLTHVWVWINTLSLAIKDSMWLSGLSCSSRNQSDAASSNRRAREF